MPTISINLYLDLDPNQIEKYTLQEILNERKYMDSDQRWWQNAVDECCDIDEWKKGLEEYKQKRDGEFARMYEYRLNLLKNKEFYEYSYNKSRKRILNKKIKKINI